MMPALQSDPDIRHDLFSLDEKLTTAQVQFVALRLRDLILRHESCRDERPRPIDWPEWSIFIDANYACGFVCGDAGDDMGDPDKTSIFQFIRQLESNVGQVASLSLRDLRRILHYILRSVRWGDDGSETGDGAVWRLITSRLGDAIAQRLGA